MPYSAVSAMVTGRRQGTRVKLKCCPRLREWNHLAFLVASRIRILLRLAGFCRHKLLIFFDLTIRLQTHNLLVPGSNPGGPTSGNVSKVPGSKPQSSNPAASRDTSFLLEISWLRFFPTLVTQVTNVRLGAVCRVDTSSLRT